MSKLQFAAYVAAVHETAAMWGCNIPDAALRTVVDEESSFEYKIISHSYFMMKNGSVFAAILETDDGSPIVITDALYDQLDDTTKKFIIAHEIGHIMNPVIDDRDEYERWEDEILEDYSVELESEYKADEYAAKIVGVEAAIHAMKDIQDSLNSCADIPEDPCADELFSMRISNLEKVTV